MYPIHEVQKENARFFISLCRYYAHTYVLVGYMDQGQNNAVHYLANFGLNAVDFDEITSDDIALSSADLEKSILKNASKKQKKQFTSWMASGIQNEGYIRSDIEMQAKRGFSSHISAHIPIAHQTFHISYRQYQEVCAQLQHIHETQQELKDYYITQYLVAFNQLKDIAKKRLKAFDSLMNSEISNEAQELMRLEKSQLDLVNNLLNKLNHHPEEIFNWWANVYQMIPAGISQRELKYFLKVAAAQKLDSVMSILNSWKKTYKISLPDEAQIRETITSDFMKSIGLFLENHARQESLLNSRSLNLPSHVDQEVKRLHTQQSCYYYKLKHINHFFAYTPNRHQYAVNYYYNQADENETHFRFVYSHDGNTAFPNNTPAAREKAKAIKLTTPFEAAKYKKLHQLKHNCKKMGLEFLANIGIQTPELSKNNVYDLSECFFVNSQYDFHSPFIIDTPTLPLPIWKKQNPYQMAILEKLYPQLIKLQKKVDREKYIILSLKNAIKTRIAEQFSLSRENTFSNQKLNYDSARFKIVEDVEDSEIPANTLRGGLNLLIEEIVPFEILRAILNQLVAKSIPKEAKVRIKHFLDLLTAKYQNQNVGRSNHIFSQEELYQTLDECIPDPILDDVKIHLKEYHELSSLYLDISDNLRYNQNQNLTHFQNELPENNPLKKELSKLSKKENKFYTHFNDLKKNVEKIQPYYPQVYKDSCELIRHIQQLHTSHSGIHNRLIKVIKSTNTLIKVLGQNPKRPEAKLAITNYKKLANSISSSSKLKLIGGIMLTLVGAVTLAAGVTSTLLSVGLFAPTGIIISAAGGCALAAGIGLLASEANIHSFFSPQARGKYHLAKQMRQTLKDAKNICHETSFSHGACA